ncbi:MAG: flavodoxin family protein [Oscillospiraceae bacterium]
MKTVILYYTLGGATKKEAERLAEKLDAPAYQVREARNRNLLTAFIPGCPQAMHRKAVHIRYLGIDLQEYDRIIIGCPVWAGFPAPAFNAIAELLPAGKEVELFFCSGGGGTPKSALGTRELIEKKGCTVVSYRDVNTGTAAGKTTES